MSVKVIIGFIIVTSFCCNVGEAKAAAGTGNPLKFISSCEIDLNNDGHSDTVLLVETLVGRELIALLRTTKGYNSYVVAKDMANMFLTCHFGKTVASSEILSEGKKRYTTPGTFIQLTQPEGSSIVYFWNGNGFTEVWTSD